VLITSPDLSTHAPRFKPPFTFTVRYRGPAGVPTLRCLATALFPPHPQWGSHEELRVVDKALQLLVASAKAVCGEDMLWELLPLHRLGTVQASGPESRSVVQQHNMSAAFCFSSGRDRELAQAGRESRWPARRRRARAFVSTLCQPASAGVTGARAVVRSAVCCVAITRVSSASHVAYPRNVAGVRR